MRRRAFLKQSGLGLGGLALAPLPAAGPSDADRPRRPTLLTSAALGFAQQLAAGLASHGRSLLLTDPNPQSIGFPFQPGGLSVAEATALARQVGAMVLIPPALAGEAWTDLLLDRWLQATYNLLRAGVEQGVTEAVYLGTLEVMNGYASDLDVNEDFAPVPDTSSGQLAAHLGEAICREFGREGMLRIAVLRLGRIALPHPAAPPDPLWLHPADAVAAIGAVLAAFERPRGLPAWSVFHLISKSPGARFRAAKAEKLLGFKPSEWPK